MKYVLVFLRNSSSIKKLQKLNLKRPQKTATQPTLICPISQQRKHQNVYEIYSELTIKKSLNGVIDVVLMSLLLSLNKFYTLS